MAPTLRVAHAEAAGVASLGGLDALIARMFALISEGLTAASEAFLGGDRAIARTVVAADRELDDLQVQIERLVEERLTDGASVEPQVARLLISILRIAPELERSGDLIEHIALRTPQGLVAGLTPRARGLLTEMGSVAGRLWVGAADAYLDRDPTQIDGLRLLDDQLDDLHVEFTAELAKGQTSVPEAVELGLIARFYERLGDHAVNVAGRMRQVAGG